MESGPATRDLQLDEALNLFGSMVCAVSYGVAFTLYCICARSLCRRLRRSGQRRIAIITLVYTTFAIACGTAYLCLVHYMIQMSYVFHRDHPGGPVVYEGLVLGTRPPFLACLILMAMLDWLTLGIQIWRLWILWRAAPYFLYVIALPVFLLLACIGVDLATAVDQGHINFTHLQYSYFIGLAFFGIPPVTTIIVTALMVSRLVLIRKRHIDLMGRSDLTSQYTGVISMLIESYALDATWSIGTIVSYVITEPIVYAIFIQASVNIKVIALFLIVYRVAKGKAWQADTEEQLSSLRYNHYPHPSPPISDPLTP